MPFGNQGAGFRNPGLVIANKVIIEGANGGEFIYSGIPATGNLIYSNTAVAGNDGLPGGGNNYLAGTTWYQSGGVINVSNGVLLVYTPTAALNNLILSFSPTAGVDSFGNVVQQGLGFYGTHAGGVNQIFTIDTVGHFLGAGLPELIWEDAANPPNAPAGIGGNSNNVAAFLELFSGKATLAGQASNIQLLDSVLSGIVNGTIQLNAGQVWVNGQIRSQGTIFAATAGSGSAESWHNLGAPIAGWTVGGRARYKLLADSGLVLVELENIQPPGAPPADNTTIWTAANGLPAGYRPLVQTGRNPAYFNGGAGGESASWVFSTDGSIQIFGVGGTTIARLDLPLLLISTI